MNTTTSQHETETRKLLRIYRRGCRSVSKHWLELADRMEDPQMKRFALDRAIDNYNTAQGMES